MEELFNNLQILLSEHNIELVDLEYVVENSNNYLRVYIESKNSKTTLDTCEYVSKLIEDICDSVIHDKFYLEVSTPGLERNLKKPSDFEKYLGYKILVKTKNNIYDKKSFTGILKGFENGNILLDEFLIPFEKVKSAKTVFEFEKELEMEDKKNES